MWKSDQISGFSLVEVMVVLVISSIGLLLMSGSVYNLHHQFTSKSGFDERIQWEKMITILESEQERFRWNGIQRNGNPILYSAVLKRNYIITQNHQNVILQNKSGQGFMPLLMNVQQFKWEYHEPFLEIWVKYQTHEYHQKVVIQRKIDNE